MSGDHVARLETWLDHDTASRPKRHNNLGDSYETVPLKRSDLRAAVNELKQLRDELATARGAMAILRGGGKEQRERAEAAEAELEQPRQERGHLAQAFANGWFEATAAVRMPGISEREAAWKTYRETLEADSAPQQPEPEAALPERQAKLLAVIQRWGGEWAPIRAQAVLVEAGYELTKERAHQIMKQLAERGYLEQVRPRAYTYRLKAEAPQQPERGGEACVHCQRPFGPEVPRQKGSDLCEHCVTTSWNRGTP